jgi:hypothetical protein
MVHPEHSRKADLLKAAEEALNQARPSDGPRQPSRWGITGPGLLLLLALGVWLFATRPEWVFPPPPVAESPEITMASMRLALIRERQLVERFRRTHGRLPATLEEAGSGAHTTSLAAGPDGTYLLRAVVGGAALELHSSDNIESFLGNSLQIILNARGRP